MEANWRMFPSPGRHFVEKGPYTIGSRYKKVVYREYTDESFKVQKDRDASQQHLEILGKFSCCIWGKKHNSAKHVDTDNF